MKYLTLTFLIAMTMIIRAGEHDQRQASRILRAIAEVESGNKDIGKHPDGVSYGKYGVTMAAVNELKRLGILSPNVQEDWLLIPETNELVARLYLNLMYRRTKCWWKAVKKYHGAGNDAENEQYVRKVWRAIK